MKFFSLIIIIFLAAGGWYVYNRESNSSLVKKTTSAPEQRSTVNQLSAQTDNTGAVVIQVIPQNITAEADTWNFKISFDTHSGSLDQDLTKVAELITEQDRFQPLGWEGDPSGGHHRSGILKFKPINPRPTWLELQIKDINQAAPNIFKWNL